MKRARSKARGVTLLEMMIVVAITGIMSGLAGVELITIIRQNRVTSSAKTLATMLRNSRVRAMVTGCPHLIQINGNAYAGTGPSCTVATQCFVTKQASATMWRKGNCASTQSWFETGDVRVEELNLADLGLGEGGVELGVAADLLADGLLDTESITIGYDRDGARLQAADLTGAGTTGYAAIAAPATNDLLFPRRPGAVASSDGLAYRTISVPLSATPKLLR
jgi:prepilin-type N-terminal cleavage/methylation domain-containing protein